MHPVDFHAYFHRVGAAILTCVGCVLQKIVQVSRSVGAATHQCSALKLCTLLWDDGEAISSCLVDTMPPFLRKATMQSQRGIF